MNVQKQHIGKNGEILQATNYTPTGESNSGEVASPMGMANTYSQYVERLLEAGGEAEISLDRVSVKTKNEKIIFSDATKEQMVAFSHMVSRAVDMQKTPEELEKELDELISAIPGEEPSKFEREFEQL